jgi:hypothetical protein
MTRNGAGTASGCLSLSLAVSSRGYSCVERQRRCKAASIETAPWIIASGAGPAHWCILIPDSFTTFAQ